MNCQVYSAQRVSITVPLYSGLFHYPFYVLYRPVLSVLYAKVNKAILKCVVCSGASCKCGFVGSGGSAAETAGFAAGLHQKNSSAAQLFSSKVLSFLKALQKAL